MSITRNSFKRPAALFAAAAVLVGAAAPALLTNNQQAFAAQLASRSISMSDSAPSGGTITTGVGSGTAVSYHVKFTTSAAMQSAVITFCMNTPLIGDATCTDPTASGMVIAGVAAAAGAPAVTWTPTVSGSSVKLAASASVGAQTVDLTLSSITNPNVLGALYARITTYTNATWGTWSAPGTEGNFVDYGGVALSVTRPITVTARVMESITLCTSSAVYTDTSCTGGVAAPAIIIGHSANNVLDATAVDVKNVYSQVSTNASNGYALYLRASNTACGGLSKDSGATCGIPAVNAGAATDALIAAGTAAFGARVTNGVNVGATGSGTNTAVARWSDSIMVVNHYLMDTASVNDNVVSTYGSKVASSAGQANGVNNTYIFGATASPTTPAGIYTENFSLIGVGTF